MTKWYKWIWVACLIVLVSAWGPELIMRQFSQSYFMNPVSYTLDRENMILTFKRETQAERDWPFIRVEGFVSMEAVMRSDPPIVCSDRRRHVEFEVIGMNYPNEATNAADRAAAITHRDALQFSVPWIADCVGEVTTELHVPYQVVVYMREGHWFSWIGPVTLPERQVFVQTFPGAIGELEELKQRVIYLETQ